MKKYIWVISLLLAGCGAKPESTVVVPSQDGNGATRVTSTNNGDKVTMQNDKSKVEIGAGTVTEADLGVPFYPGSTESAGANMKGSEGGKTTVMATRATSDTPQKVIDFYTEKLGKPKGSVTMGEGTTATWEPDDKTTFSVSASKTDKETQILIVKGSK